MFEFIVTSDFHIGSLKNVFADALHKQITEIFKIYKYAASRGIKYVIIPGDLTDTATISDVELIELIKLFLAFDDNIVTYYIAGNHDYFSVKKSSLGVLECLCEEGLLQNLHIIREPMMKKIEGTLVNFMPFPHVSFPESKKPYLNFVHLDVDGAVGDNGHLIKVKKDVDFGEGNVTISGHNHKYQKIASKRLIYCGNPYQKKFSEELPKGFLECKAGYKDGQLRLKHEFINNMPEFELRTVHIASERDLQKLVKSDSVAYKITTGDGVVLPADIGKQFNITTVKNPFNAQLVTADYGIQKTNLKTGLKPYLLDAGLSKAQLKTAAIMMKEAIRELAIG